MSSYLLAVYGAKPCVTYPRAAAGAPAYEAFELIYDSGYLISTSGFEKSKAVATECGMRDVLALIYDERGELYMGQKFGGEFRNGKTLNRRIRSAIIFTTPT